MKGDKVYVASSWRNDLQPEVVKALRESGHLVYDFKDPIQGGGFYWGDIDSDWQNWNLSEAFFKCHSNEAAVQGFINDAAAIRDCDILVLVLPCGRSAHLEAGVAVGLGKEVVILSTEPKMEAELMYMYASDVFTSIEAMIKSLEEKSVTSDPLLWKYQLPKSVFGKINPERLPNWGRFADSIIRPSLDL